MSASIPRGVALSGLEFGSAFPGQLNTDYFESSQNTYNYFGTTKKFDTVRLPFMWERLQPTLNTALDTTYKGYIDDQITKAAAAGLKVILDCHNFGRRNILKAGGFTSDFTASTDVMWQGGTISGGVLSINSFAGRAYGGLSTNTTPCIITADLIVTSDNAQPWAAAWLEVARADDDNKYFVTLSATGGYIQLYKVVAGVQTSLGSYSTTIAFNTPYTLIVDVDQTTLGTITVTLNGTTRITASTDGALTTGNIALYGNGANCSIDNVTVNLNGDSTSGNSGSGYFRVGDPQLPITAFSDLWTRIATAYTGNATVYGYDLMNEPHDMPVPTSTSNYSGSGGAGGLAQLTYRSIDAMKYTKDNVRSQPTDFFITSYCNFLAANFNITHVAIAVPLEAQADWVSAGVVLPSPRTVENYTKKWCDAIHAAGLKVLFRGSYCQIEGTYDFPQLVGPNRITQSAWMTKISNLITNNPTWFQTGDIWAPIPEGTGNGIFSDATSFIDYGGSGVQANYAAFFAALHSTSNTAFSGISVSGVITGLSTNNWSEVNSGWIPSSLFTDAGLTVFDDYPHDVATLINDYDVAYAKGHNIYHQEWSDYWNSGMTQPTRTAYLQGIYNKMVDYANAGKLIGFNYWGGWTDGSGEQILTNSGTDTSPVWGLAFNGAILQSYFQKAGSTVTLMEQAAITAIRAVDTGHYIFAELDSWAGAQSFVGQYGSNPTPWLTDTASKLVYSFHYYFDDDHSGSYQLAFKNSNNTNISGDTTPVMQWGANHSLKMHCGEFGVPNAPEWQVCLTTFITLMNTYNVWANHWAAGDPYTSITTLQPTGVSPVYTDVLQMAILNTLLYQGDPPVIPPTPPPPIPPTPVTPAPNLDPVDPVTTTWVDQTNASTTWNG